MELSNLKAVIEAMLYVSEGPLPLSRIREAVGEDVEAATVREALVSVMQDFDADARGVRIAELAGGYQIVTRAEHAPFIRRLQKIKPPKLSAQSLETLAIIAYRQPIIRAEIEVIRGVSSGGTLKTLLERRLVRIAGRQDVPGKPMMYATTSEFLRYFGLKDLASLPPMRELERELGMEENSILSNLEPELPGLDGPEMERMAEEYRARRAAVEAEGLLEESELGDDQLERFIEEEGLIEAAGEADLPSVSEAEPEAETVAEPEAEPEPDDADLNSAG